MRRDMGRPGAGRRILALVGAAALFAAIPGATAAQDTIRLGVVVQAGGPGEAVKKLAEEYMTLHAGTTVEVTDMQYDATREAAVADFTSHGAAYDVVAFDYLWMKEYAEGGFILPLDDMVAAKADAVQLDDFFQPYVEYGKLNDKLYGLPWLGAVYMLYYRTDLLEQANIAVDRKSVV